MLSTAAIKSGQEAYYLKDYYSEGRDAAGEWSGSGAAILGTRGTVRAESLHQVIRGFSPEGRPLVQNAGREGERGRQVGWDFTFSVPKGVSVLWAVTDEVTRRRIERAHKRAVTKALGYLEENAAFARRGKGGAIVEPTRLLVATFTHGTNRLREPALHDHALIVNVGVRPDGTTGSILSKPLYQHKMAAGAVYRAELAAVLERELGIVCERDGTSFKVAGVPEALCRHFSTRRRDIDEWLKRAGTRSAEAAAVAALQTRKPKGRLPAREALFAIWRETAREFDFDARRVIGRSQRRLTEHASPEALRRVAEDFVRTGPKGFRERDLVRAVAVAAQGTGHGADQALAAAREVLGRGRTIREERSKDDVVHTVLPPEREIARLRKEVGLLSLRRSHGVSRFAIAKVLSRYAKPRSPLLEELRHHRTQLGRALLKKPTSRVDRSKLRTEAEPTLSDEQKLTVLRLTREGGCDLRVLESTSGAERDLMLRASAEAWEAGGYRVLGAAASGGGRYALEQRTGIKSYSAERLLRLLKPTLASRLTHDVTQLARAAAKKPTRPFKPFRLTDRTVIVVDTRGLDARALHRLLRAARTAGAMVVTTGEAHYLNSISRDHSLRERVRTAGTASPAAQRARPANRAEEERRYAEGR